MRGRMTVVVVLVVAFAARPSLAAGPERFIAWLGSHPDVSFVLVASDHGAPDLFGQRFPQRRKPPETWPSAAFTSLTDAAGSLACLMRGGRSVCARVPVAHQTRVEVIQDNRAGTRLLAWFGPAPDRRPVNVYEFALPAATVREGSSLPVNPRWSEGPRSPWWVMVSVADGPFTGNPNPRKAMREARVIAGVPGPDWLADIDQFAVGPSDDPRALRVETSAGTSVCVRTARWTCHGLPTTSLDEVHPGLPPTDSRLVQGPPQVFRIQTRSDDPNSTDIVVERDWIRSEKPHTPSMEFTGTFIELMRVGPSGNFERRALLETTYGRFTRMGRGFLLTRSLSDRCVDIVAVGDVPPKFAAAAPGRYCLDAAGRLVRGD